MQLATWSFGVPLFTTVQHRHPAGHTVSLSSPQMLAHMNSGNKLYASHQPESPKSQKATFTHLTEPPHDRYSIPFPFPKSCCHSTFAPT